MRLRTLATRRLIPAAATAALLAGAQSAHAVSPNPVYNLAGRCFTLQSVANGKFVTITPPGLYRATAGSPAGASAFYFKATALGRYLMVDQQGGLIAKAGAGTTSTGVAGPLAEWAPEHAGGQRYRFRPGGGGLALSVNAGDGGLVSNGGRDAAATFTLAPSSACSPFPEAELDATGTPRRSVNRDGSVFGFVDSHLHITADMRAGGRVIYGEAFDRFGIPAALGRDAGEHGPDGSLDVTGNLLRTGLPFGTHDTHGWPTFIGWPTHDTQTHQQTYYVWLERAFKAGLRLVVAQTADDEPICRIEPRKNGSCDETRSIKAQIRRLRGLQDYVDAQSGGPGRGWFRLVTSPAQARRVIARGKLAVVIGIESSDLFGCSERGGKAQCTRRDIDRGLRAYRRLGVRGMFVAHWINNALAGSALEGGAKGLFINIFNAVQTGGYFKTARCPARSQGEQMGTLSAVELSVLTQFFPATKQLAAMGEPTYPKGRRCNARGLTPLGRYAIRRMMAAHMLIEVDHMSERARDTVLAIAARSHYPLISSHNGTGGEWTPSELRTLHRLGGYASVTPDVAPKLAAKILRMARFGFSGVGIGTDTGGFSSLPGPRPDAARKPLRYPFTSYDGRVSFTRERTGTRTFDLNSDGVAQYGLFADLVADMQQNGGRRALAPFFRSAEAYLRTWQRALRHR
jgi:microsomal dipeptidase-like Zn-dependent dipeptidase